MGNLQPRAKLIWSLTASGLGTTLAGAGNSGDWGGAGSGDWPPIVNAETAIDLREITDVVLMVAVGDIVSSPSLQVGLDVYDDLGNLYANVLQTAAVTTAVNTVPLAAGGLHGGYDGTASSYLVLPEWGRVSWTLSGGSMTGVQIALYGR